ncbi:hypothetical protein KCU89_g13183, partial [Aureobasidium melanogenum]
MATTNYSGWARDPQDANKPHDWNADRDWLNNGVCSWVMKDPLVEQFFAMNNILDLAAQGKCIWFMGCGNGKELDKLLSTIPRAKVLGIDKAKDLCKKARQNLGAGSLKGNPNKADHIIYEGDITDIKSLEAIGKHTGSRPDIIVCLHVMHLFTRQHQTNVATMWLDKLLVQTSGNRIIFTTRQQDKECVHGFHFARKVPAGIPVHYNDYRFAMACQQDRRTMESEGDMIAKMINVKSVSGTTAKLSTFPSSAPSGVKGKLRGKNVFLANGQSYDVPPPLVNRAFNYAQGGQYWEVFDEHLVESLLHHQKNPATDLEHAKERIAKGTEAALNQVLQNQLLLV